MIAGCVLTALVPYGFAAVQNKKLPTSVRELMCFRDSFGVPEKDRLDISIHGMEDVLDISKAVWSFCEEHGVTGRRQYSASLCMEELAGNIVLHGFTDGKKHCIDIRVSYIRDEIVLCVKDDCRAFNPKEAAELFDPDDKVHNVGLRLAAAMAGRMSYQNTFGLNILTITV